MKKSLKTLAMWLIIGIIFIILISAIMDNKENKMTYSELMVAIQSGTIESIEIEIDKGLLKTEESGKGYVTLKNNNIQYTNENIVDKYTELVLRLVHDNLPNLKKVDKTSEKLNSMGCGAGAPLGINWGAAAPTKNARAIIATNKAANIIKNTLPPSPRRKNLFF